jgi:hypothetical protein
LLKQMITDSAGDGKSALLRLNMIRLAACSVYRIRTWEKKKKAERSEKEIGMSE